ncbi:hypothetical protein Zmor_024809, partial [Zophobas morio]
MAPFLKPMLMSTGMHIRPPNNQKHLAATGTMDVLD